MFLEGEKMTFLVPVSIYLKCGPQIGGRFRSKKMKKYIHEIKKNGLTIFGLDTIDQRIKQAAKLLLRFS